MLLRNKFSQPIVDLFDRDKVTTSFNMFIDMELMDLASLITKASWANFEDYSLRTKVPSALAQKRESIKK